MYEFYFHLTLKLEQSKQDKFLLGITPLTLPFSYKYAQLMQYVASTMTMVFINLMLQEFLNARDGPKVTK